jgi:hypothetical protein
MAMESSGSRLDTAPWGIDDLIAVAEKVMASNPGLFAHPESETSKELNIRLIRDYVVREFIPRPERVGRESRFGLDHLVHLLAIRALLRSQKWSLPAIKASFLNTGTQELMGGILQPVMQLIIAEYDKARRAEPKRAPSASDRVRTPELNPAQLLIQQFKAPTGHGEPDVSLTHMALSARRVASPALQTSTSISRKLHVELEPWCEVVIDAQRMKSLTGEEIERLGEALKSRLKIKTAR